MTRLLSATRREFLAASSSAFVFSLFTGAGSAHAPASTLQAIRPNALVLYRANESHARKFASEFVLAGYMTRELGNDPVRQWRDEFGTLVVQDKFMLLGLGSWADFSILRGLAAEHRRFPLLLTQHNKFQPTQAEWASRHAQALLAEDCLNSSERLALFAHNLNNKSTINTGQASLFSWII